METADDEKHPEFAIPDAPSISAAIEASAAKAPKAAPRPPLLEKIPSALPHAAAAPERKDFLHAIHVFNREKLKSSTEVSTDNKNTSADQGGIIHKISAGFRHDLFSGNAGRQSAKNTDLSTFFASAMHRYNNAVKAEDSDDDDSSPWAVPGM